MKACFIFCAALFIFKLTVAQTPQREQLVKNVVLAFQNDFNDGRFLNAVDYTTEDWTHINPGGGITKGRSQVLNEVRAVHKTFLKHVSISIKSIAIKFVSATVAVVNVVHESTDYELPPGIKHQNEQQMKTYVIVKAKNKWLLRLDQNTIIAKY